MIRQKLAKPLVPYQIDLMLGRRMTVGTVDKLKQSSNAQIDFRQMRVGAEMITDNDRAFLGKIGDGFFQIVLADMEMSQ